MSQRASKSIETNNKTACISQKADATECDSWDQNKAPVLLQKLNP